MPPPFRLLGPDHLAALLLTVAVAGLGVRWVRCRRPEQTAAVRRTVAVLLVGLTLGELAFAIVRGYVDLSVVLPLQLCDLALLLAAYVLVTLDRRASGLLYFLALSGTLLALLTPELRYGFPSWDYVFFFLPHGLVVVSAIVLTFGHGFVPARDDWWKAIVFVNLYAAVAGAANLALGTNFAYLCAKPRDPSPFDWFGPWPLYLATLEVVTVVLMWLLDLPLRRFRRAGLATAPVL